MPSVFFNNAGASLHSRSSHAARQQHVSGNDSIAPLPLGMSSIVHCEPGSLVEVLSGKTL